MMRRTMPSPARIALALPSLLIPAAVAQIETVSINTAYPHFCVGRCVFDPFVVGGAIEEVLGCAKPQANKCFCPTASAPLSTVDSWVTACASTQCGKGDLSDDLAAMKSMYASYCLGAGFTQPIISTWYTPTSETNTEGEPPSTTTRASGTVRRTSTQRVDDGDSNIPAPETGGSGPNQVALGVGLGLGIPAALAAGVGLGLLLRRRRTPQDPPPRHGDPPVPQSRLPRRPVPTPVSPLGPNSPVAIRADHELLVPEMRPELPGQTETKSPYKPERQHWELP